MYTELLVDFFEALLCIKSFFVIQGFWFNVSLFKYIFRFSPRNLERRLNGFRSGGELPGEESLKAD